MSDYISRQAAIEEIARRDTTDGSIKVYSGREVIEILRSLPCAQPELIRCKDCKNSEHWYRDRRRCFLWAEEGISVFDDGFCNYAERRTDG